MRKVLWSSAMIGCTLLSTFILIAWKPREQPVEARLVKVKRGDVHQVVGLAGRLAYADEKIIYAQSAGRVEQICVSAGDRVGQNEALIRFENDAEAAWIAAAAAAGQEREVNFSDLNTEYNILDSHVIRATSPCSVRDIYVEETSLVTMGMPVARVSSHQQEIVCTAAVVDASKVNQGMWAWISKAGESHGFAEVTSVSDKKTESMTGKTYVEIRLKPEQHIELDEGESIDVDVYIAGSDDVMTLPIEAITSRDTVWWVSEGRCTEIPAQIVMTDEMLAWVALPEGISIAIGEFYDGQVIAEALE